MEFAMFYEIPVPRPWDEESEHRAYKAVIEEAVFGEKMGFSSFWTVEHHFLEEYSHCSNPEVLYGAIAALTSTLRLGYGVRLTPKPYNHPVRSAESAAVLDLISDGRVEFGTGRSSTRAELEGFGVHPSETREMWQEAVEHIVGCWTHDEYEFSGKHWSMPKRRVLPKPLQKPHPPIWGATGSLETHRLVGQLGLGLLSFAVGTPPSELKKRIDVYREGLAECEKPLGAFVNDRAASFTMVNVAPTTQESVEIARESFEWYPKHGARIIASVAQWLEEEKLALGSYEYLQTSARRVEEGMTDLITMDYLMDTNACVAGDPDQAIEMFKAYEATGCDVVFCLMNPYSISHENVMQTIELMGEHVIPAFR